jgi:hypothetical protein
MCSWECYLGEQSDECDPNPELTCDPHVRTSLLRWRPGQPRVADDAVAQTDGATVHEDPRRSENFRCALCAAPDRSAHASLHSRSQLLYHRPLRLVLPQARSCACRRAAEPCSGISSTVIRPSSSARSRTLAHCSVCVGADGARGGLAASPRRARWGCRTPRSTSC